MRYEKPELAVLGTAAGRIQGQKNEAYLDSDQEAQHPSDAAYEADE